ncbi:MAG: peptidylprolyl isomerase [Acidobacteriia bacterium]|nr:peptidylprolyl isomerase [Terriglobia bacterium]
MAGGIGPELQFIKVAVTPMRKLLPLFLVCVAALPVAFGADTVIEEIIARVNNRIITRSEYLRSQEELKKEAQQQDPVNADKLVAEKEKDVLRDLVDQQLLLDKGKDMDISADTELVKRLDQMRKQMNLDSMEDLEKAAQAQGIAFEDFKQNLRNQIITQQVIGSEVGRRLVISKEEMQNFYEAHKSEFDQPEQVRLGEILVSTEKKSVAGDEAAQLQAAKAKADSLLEQIKGGAKFEDIAKKDSDGPSAAQGGDLGYFKRGTLAKELEDKTFAMKSGEVSDVIRTKQGFIILKVTEHQEAGVPPFSQVEPRIQDAVYMQKLQPALREYLTKLREEAFIDIKPGYVDTAASSKESKPIETAAKDPNAKPLRKKKKFGLF